MSPTGKWVEVQIRSVRMDEMAEKGFAAHWKYKDSPESPESKLDKWLNQVRDVLENPEDNAIDFIDNFKLSLFSEEIYVFTPNGDMKTLPVGTTALDFAFHIHSQIGSQCIGAKVNYKLVPLSHKLRSGDQVEILTSKKQHPKEDWLRIVITASARHKIRDALREEKKVIAEEGKEMLKRKFHALKVDFLSKNIDEIVKHYDGVNASNLYVRIAKGSIDLTRLKGFAVDNGRIRFEKEETTEPAKDGAASQESTRKVITAQGKGEALLIGDEQQRVDYKLASCCNPIPGDEVFGFITVSEGINIHRTNCPNAQELLSKYAYRVMKARWHNSETVQFEVGLRFSGTDDVGIVQNITNIISTDMNVNMRAISFEANHGIFQGKVVVLVHDTKHLSALIDKLKAVEGVLTVDRIESEFE
jgi:GTP pyrophosphokinase